MTENDKVSALIGGRSIVNQISISEDKFDDMFNDFLIHYRFIDDDIKRLLLENDYEKAKLLTHSVGEIANGLGISNLKNSAAALEKSISNHSETAIQSEIKQFSRALAAIITGITVK